MRGKVNDGDLVMLEPCDPATFEPDAMDGMDPHGQDGLDERGGRRGVKRGPAAKRGWLRFEAKRCKMPDR
jgi:hypothetical protein